MKKLTQLKAFNAISKLFQIYYKETLSDDYGTLLGAMSFIGPYRTADPSMWDDWKLALDKKLGNKNLRNYNHLSPLQVLKVLPFFLDLFFEKDLFDDITFIIREIDLVTSKKINNSILWKNWKQSVDEVLAVDDSRNYLKFTSSSCK